MGVVVYVGSTPATPKNNFIFHYNSLNSLGSCKTLFKTILTFKMIILSLMSVKMGKKIE